MQILIGTKPLLSEILEGLCSEWETNVVFLHLLHVYSTRSFVFLSGHKRALYSRDGQDEGHCLHHITCNALYQTWRHSHVLRESLVKRFSGSMWNVWRPRCTVMAACHGKCRTLWAGGCGYCTPAPASVRSSSHVRQGKCIWPPLNIAENNILKQLSIIISCRHNNLSPLLQMYLLSLW